MVDLWKLVLVCKWGASIQVSASRPTDWIIVREYSNSEAGAGLNVWLNSFLDFLGAGGGACRIIVREFACICIRLLGMRRCQFIASSIMKWTFVDSLSFCKFHWHWGGGGLRIFGDPSAFGWDSLGLRSFSLEVLVYLWGRGEDSVHLWCPLWSISWDSSIIFCQKVPRRLPGRSSRKFPPWTRSILAWFHR